MNDEIEAPLNPYVVTLGVIAAIALIGAGLLAGIANGNHDTATAISQLAWAGELEQIGIGAGLLWLVVCAMRWKRSS